MRNWIVRRFELYGQSCMLGAIFLCATIFAPLSIDTFNLVKLTVLWTLGILALGLWLAICIERRAWPPPTRIFGAATLFILFAAVSAALSSSPKLSVLGHYTRYGGVVPYLTYALIALAIYGLFWERPDRLSRIAHSVFAASVVVAGYVLIQAAGLDWHPWQNPAGDLPVSPTSTLGNSNFAGGYLGAALPLAVDPAVSVNSHRMRPVLGGFLALHVLALWFTQARGGMAGSIAGLAAISFCYRERIPRWAKAGIISALVLVSVIAVVAIWHPGRDSPPEAVSSVRQLDSFSLQNRFWYWTAAARIFRDHPFLGTGPDTYLSYYPRYRLAEDGRVMGLNLPDKPHNVPLEHFSSEGALGGSAFLLTAGLGLWYGYRRSRQLAGRERLLLVCFTGALTAYLGQSFFSIDVPAVAAMCWICLGAIAAMAEPAAVVARLKTPDPGPDQTIESRVVPKKPMLRAGRLKAFSTQVALFALVSGLILFGTRPLRADVKAAAGMVEEAISLNPLEAQYNISAGDAVRSVAASTRDLSLATQYYERAERHYGKALTIQPGNIIIQMKLASLRATWAQTLDASQVIEAARRWQRIHNLSPHDKDIKSANDSARTAERRLIEQSEQLVKLHPDSVVGWVGLGKIYLELRKYGDAQSAFRRAVTLDPESKVARSLLRQSLRR